MQVDVYWCEYSWKCAHNETYLNNLDKKYCVEGHIVSASSLTQSILCVYVAFNCCCNFTSSLMHNRQYVQLQVKHR